MQSWEIFSPWPAKRDVLSYLCIHQMIFTSESAHQREPLSSLISGFHISCLPDVRKIRMTDVDQSSSVYPCKLLRDCLSRDLRDCSSILSTLEIADFCSDFICSALPFQQLPFISFWFTRFIDAGERYFEDLEWISAFGS